MKKALRKTLALIMTVFMMVSLCSVGVIAITENVDHYTMELGSGFQIDVWEDTPNRYFVFEPEESGTYYFYSRSGQYVSYGKLYDEQNNLIAEDFGNAENGCFVVEANLTAGETYELVVGSVDGKYGNFFIGVDTVAVESLIIQPISYVEGSHGYYTYGNWDENGVEIESTKYFYYSAWQWEFNYTAVMTDGGTVSGQGNSSFEYGGKRFDFESYIVQDYQNQWTAGNTYYPTLSVMGASAKVNVSISESPIESITVSDIDLIVESQGTYWDYTDDDGETQQYFHYGWEGRVRGTILYTDGHTEELTNSGIDYNGEFYPISYYSKQDSENQWTEGNSYDVSISILGASADLKVNIIPSPIKSISINPVKITEGTNCDYVQDYIGEQPTGFYNRYYLDRNIQYTVTMKNDEVFQGSGMWFTYNNEEYQINFKDTQSFENQWTVGNTYTAKATLMGASCDVSYTIEATPFESVTFTPVTIIEGTNGHNSSYYDYDKGEVVEYWYYEIWSKLGYTVTLTNGETISGYGAGFHYNGDWISFSMNDTQWGNPWTVGNTYTVNISACGSTVPVDVTIIESPIVDIQVQPILLTENDGYYRYDYNPETQQMEEYIYYDWCSYEYLSYKVIMNDGNFIECTGTDGFSFNDDWLNVSYTNSQSLENQYIKGNTYTESITVLGYSADVKITISEELSSGDYFFIVQDGNAYITSYVGEDTVIEIPEELDNYPVAGILNIDIESITEISIPDSVTMLSSNWAQYLYSLKELNVGSNVTSLSNSMFDYNEKLEAINVSQNNANYKSVDGVVYDTALTTMLVVPLGKTTRHTLPDSVTDIEIFIDGFYQFSLDLANSKTDYIIEDGILYNKEKTAIYDCDPEKTGEYIMPESVQEIAFSAFENSKLSSVKIASGVAFIEYRAFANCKNLTSITLPEKLSYMGSEAFLYCESLEEIKLPDTLEGIGYKTFYHSGIKSIKIPANIIEIGPRSFEGTPLQTLTIEEGAEYIGSRAFAETAQLKEVVLPDSVLYMEDSVFCNSGLEKITFGSNIREIFSDTFRATHLKTVTIPENITYIGEFAFENCLDLEEVVFESEELYIDEAAFRNCPIKELNLKDMMVNIGRHAFSGSALTSIDLPESVTRIEYKVFENSKDLADINIPDNIESLDGFAFHGTAWYNSKPDGDVYLENSYYGYKGEMPENAEVVIKEGTKLIADYAFSDAKDINLKSITLPASLEHIGWDTFYSSLNLEEINIADGNENFTYEDGVLSDKDGRVIWAKPMEIEYCYDLIDVFTYGEEYYFNEWFGMEVVCAGGNYIYYSKRNDVTDKIKVSGYNPEKIGPQIVTLELEGMTYSYEVFVNASKGDPTCAGLYVEKPPRTTEYDLNQSLRTNGMVVMGVTYDGEAVEVTNYSVSGYNPTVPGTQTVTVSYYGLTADFTVTVNPAKVTFTSTTTEEKIEVSVPQDVIEEGAELVIEKQEVESIKEQVEELPEDFKEDNSLIFDISFEKEEQTVQPTDEVTVSIPVPEHIDGNRCKVYHIGESGYEEMEAVYKDGFMVFATNHFSYYGIVQAKGSLLSGAITSFGNLDDDITLSLYKDENLVEEISSNNGNYHFDDIISGEYVITAKKAGHIVDSFVANVGNENTIKNIKMEMLGDANRDDAVDITDLGKFKLALSGSSSDYYAKATDINGDGVFNTTDLAKLKLYLASGLMDYLG